MVSSSMKFVKFALFFFNMLLFLAGLCLIIVGAVIQGYFNDYFAFFGGRENVLAILLVIIGVVVFVIGFFGCCGAYKESHCMIITFSILLSVILILEIAAAISACKMKNEVSDFVEQNMKQTLKNYDNEKHVGVSATWDMTQRKFSCCGVTNYTDWQTNLYMNNSVPDSCCVTYINKCGNGVLASHLVENINTKGCLIEFINLTTNNILIIAGVGFFFSIFQIVGITLACCLASSLRHQYETV